MEVTLVKSINNIYFQEPYSGGEPEGADGQADDAGWRQVEGIHRRRSSGPHLLSFFEVTIWIRNFPCSDPGLFFIQK
jgi:hypothetical protein